jgi:hypothetical protein
VKLDLENLDLQVCVRAHALVWGGKGGVDRGREGRRESPHNAYGGGEAGA